MRGEAGSGKELVARRLHAVGARRHGPFVTVNCAALSESQLEVALFGHEPLVLTDGAREDREGLLARAEGGTIYLDAIETTGRALQARLLRLLQDRSYRRVGGLDDRRADVRVVAGTTRDLRAEVDAGRTPRGSVPPAERDGDRGAAAARAPGGRAAARALLPRSTRSSGRQGADRLHRRGDRDALRVPAWPGNVRELESAILHAAIACQGGMVDECHLPKFTGGLLDGRDEILRNVVTLDANDCSIRSLEEQLCRKVLEQTRWNISKAASRARHQPHDALQQDPPLRPR